MRVGGVCSGIGGFALAAERNGMDVAWEVEIDANCRRLLGIRFPSTLIYDDMTTFEPSSEHAIDILTGGTPCQGFSVAGLRKSLSDDRSNLALRFIQLADRLNPAVIFWENVPGVLSTDDNAFGCFLAGLVGADAPLVPPAAAGGRWTDAGVVAGPRRTAAWRCLDAQYFGLAQRRKRVFVVASPRAELPFQILFEPEGVRRDSPPSRETGEGTAGAPADCLNSGGNSGGFRTEPGSHLVCRDVAHALACHMAKGGDPTTDNYVAHTLRGEGFDASEDGTGRGTPLVATAIDMRNATRTTEKSDQNRQGSGIGETEGPVPTLTGLFTPAIAFSCKDSGADAGELSPTLRAMNFDGSHMNGGGQVAVVFDTTQITSVGNVSNPQPGDPCHPLASGAHPPALVTTLAIRGRGEESNLETREDGLANAILTPNGGRAGIGCGAVAIQEVGKRTGTSTDDVRCGIGIAKEGEPMFTLQAGAQHGVGTMSAVRRLTPLECCRLQGFPDDWFDACGFSDSTMYRALGNAVAVPVVEWILQRIKVSLK